MENSVRIRIAAIGFFAVLFVVILITYFKISTQSGLGSNNDSVTIAETQMETGGVETETDVVTMQLAPPSFDTVRVSKFGLIVVAGNAKPNSDVTIILDGKVIGEAQVNRAGAFVAFINIDPADTPRELSLVQKQTTGEDLVSVDKILIMPFKSDAKEAPKLVVSKSEGIEVIASAKTRKAATQEAATAESLSLDTIVYDNLGDVVISGKGKNDNYVRIYLDNKSSVVQEVPDDGNWKVTLPDVPDGLYELRVDSVDSKGAVKERVQSPFKRETAKAAIASISANQTNVTIQPGYTLWALADKRYGNGLRYVQIFESNRDQIKNPNLIYPGQIFDLPD